MLGYIAGFAFLWILYRVITHEDRELEKQIKKRKEAEAGSLADAVKDVAKWKMEKGIPRVGREEDFYPND